MERVELRGVNLINGTTQQQERGNVARSVGGRGGGGGQGHFTLRRLTIPAASFPG